MEIHYHLLTPPSSPKVSLEALLWEACSSGSAATTWNIISHGSLDPNWRDPDLFRSSFYRACGHGHVEIVRLLLEDERVDVNLPTCDDVTPLFIACQEGHVEVVRVLLGDERVAVSTPTTDGATPFFVACQEGREEIAQLLLEHSLGADLNRGDLELATPLFMACQNGHVGIVELLLRQGRLLEVNVVTDEQTTPLSTACENGHVAIVRLLLEDERVDVNLPDSENCTALWISAQNGHVEIVEWLLASRDFVDVSPKWVCNGNTAEEQARQAGYDIIADLICFYSRNPSMVREELKRRLGMKDQLGADIFSQIVLHSDDFLKLTPKGEVLPASRFFKISSRLPLELQMILANRCAGLEKTFIPSRMVNDSLKKLAAFYLDGESP